MDVYVKIHELKSLGYKQRRVDRETTISRGSIRKYWDMTPEEYAQYVIDCKT